MTTLLNATVWLLAATCAAGIWGATRGQDARSSFTGLLRLATTLPALIVMIGLAGAGVASRAAIGFLSPGAYAEEVVAARSFLEDRSLYREGSDRAGAWIADATTPLPFATLPGMTSCEAESLNQRARFYTSQAHTPMLLLGGVPLVSLAGSRGLFVTLCLASLLAIAAMAVVLARVARVPLLSREGWLIAAAIAGWQPVLAGIKQGDAVLPVAGMIVVAWWLARQPPGTRGATFARTAGAGLAAAAAAALALPALGVLPALACTWRRAALLAAGVFTLSIATVVALSGWSTLSTFAGTSIETGRVYAAAPTNYAIGPRIAGLHVAPLLGILLIAAVAARTWAPLRDADKSFAAFLPLGLLMSPLLWSQHFALALIPAVVLLTVVLRGGSAAALAVWSGLLLVISLPDGPSAALARLVPLTLGANPLPAASLALIVLWIWSVLARPGVAQAASAPVFEPARAMTGRP